MVLRGCLVLEFQFLKKNFFFFFLVIRDRTVCRVTWQLAVKSSEVLWLFSRMLLKSVLFIGTIFPAGKLPSILLRVRLRSRFFRVSPRSRWPVPHPNSQLCFQKPFQLHISSAPKRFKSDLTLLPGFFCFVLFSELKKRSLPWPTSNSSSGIITEELPLSWRVSGADGKLERSNVIIVCDEWLMALNKNQRQTNKAHS